jgi:hypothetical protein
MTVEQIIAEIEWLEQLYRLPDERRPTIAEWRKARHQNAATDRLEKLFLLPDERPPRPRDRKIESPVHDEKYTDDPRFRLWRPDGE